MPLADTAEIAIYVPEGWGGGVVKEQVYVQVGWGYCQGTIGRHMPD